MKILVTGGAGFIGSNLAETLLKRGDEVIAIDNFNDYYSPARKRANVASALNNTRYHLHEIDFRDASAVRQIVKQHQPDVIAHLGAMGSVRYSVKHPNLYVEVNVNGTVNLLSAAQESGVDHFVFASTSSVYGQTDQVPFVETQPSDAPLAPYPATKKAGEVMGHAFHNMHGLQFTALRFFNVYGPRGRPDMMPYMVLENIVNNREITLFDDGNMHRDWTYVDDILSGVVAAIDHPMEYEIFNLGRGEPVLMRDFIEIAEEIAGKQAIIKVVEAPASEPKITYANIDKARQRLGYDPQTSIVDGLTKFWEWYQRVIRNED